jgi:pectate lyase
VTRAQPLWIVFVHSMTIRLKGELLVSSYKTIDGCGATVHLVGSSQVSIENASNLIIHGVDIHDVVRSGPHHILSSPSRLTLRAKTVGDAIHIEGSRDVWIDHCSLANAADGLIDCTMNSTSVTISNCYFENHDKVRTTSGMLAADLAVRSPEYCITLPSDCVDR